MDPAKKKHIIQIDGRTGEGGGQLVRIACTLSAVTGKPIRITHIRANRSRAIPKTRRKPGAEGWNKGWSSGPSSSSGGNKGTGLKSQHLTAISFLASQTGAHVSGLEIGSRELDFFPFFSSPSFCSEVGERGGNSNSSSPIIIDPPTDASSITLIFQALLPFLLLTTTYGKGGKEGREGGKGGTEIIIRGGTNVSFSPSWEYLDQVLIPEVEDRFCFSSEGTGGQEEEEGKRRIRIERRLIRRGWALGSSGKGGGKGEVWFRVGGEGGEERGATTLVPTTNTTANTLIMKDDDGDNRETMKGTVTKGKGKGRIIDRIEATILTPSELHGPLAEALKRDIASLFTSSPSSGQDEDSNQQQPSPSLLTITQQEESHHPARMYILLVAFSSSPSSSSSGTRRFAHDHLFSSKYKGKTPTELADMISRKVVRGLWEEVPEEMNTDTGVVDRHLQDQLVVFQALARGRTEVRLAGSGGGEEKEEEEGEEEDFEGQRDRVERLDTTIINNKEEKEEEKGREGEGKERWKGKGKGNRMMMMMKRDKRTREPFGEGSMHAMTARWVASELLPTVKWFDNGTICEGAGVACFPTTPTEGQEVESKYP